MPFTSEKLDTLSPSARVLVQSLANSAATLSQNALLLRSLLPGGKLPEADNLKGEGGAKKGKKRSRGEEGGGAGEEKKKRALSGYLVFAGTKRDGIKADQPGIKPTEVMKSIGTLWKALSDKEKKGWQERASKIAAGEAVEPIAAPAKKSKKSKS
jgi:hypothetical protein